MHVDDLEAVAVATAQNLEDRFGAALAAKDAAALRADGWAARAADEPAASRFHRARYQLCQRAPALPGQRRDEQQWAPRGGG